MLAGLFALVVFVSVYRRPTADQLALGLAAISLAAFIALTTMHERYAYPALVFLLFALGRPAVAVAWVAFAMTFLLNLVVAVPPEGWVIPEVRAFTIVGSIAMTVIALWVLDPARGAGSGPRRAQGLAVGPRDYAASGSWGRPPALSLSDPIPATIGIRIIGISARLWRQSTSVMLRAATR